MPRSPPDARSGTVPSPALWRGLVDGISETLRNGEPRMPAIKLLGPRLVALPVGVPDPPRASGRAGEYQAIESQNGAHTAKRPQRDHNSMPWLCASGLTTCRARSPDLSSPLPLSTRIGAMKFRAWRLKSPITLGRNRVPASGIYYHFAQWRPSKPCFFGGKSQSRAFFWDFHFPLVPSPLPCCLVEA